ncbi:hypothetical protein M413DRAFT_441504 [Hebeloma cylindrosporum]|uniref:Uncharacterized protein n=1 Tax=Hebeloma cylindrosporum TaxID=76867 RepID=A0A0C3CC94_HEBCY|nr:hypothetical protein M413DRAFT_441504 [Hebeloma cylindrosporum h7]
MEAISITTPTNPTSNVAAALASTSTNTAKPLSRANAAIISKKPQSRVKDKQPSTADLKKFGVKVRDFAYEKTLPPVRTVHLHRQVLPGVVRQSIARQKTEEDASQSQQSQSQPRTVDRTPTEPSLTPVPPKRAGGLFDLELELEESDDENTTLSQRPSTREFPSAQIPQILFESQESQPRADTPVLTSNDSWNWNSSDIPRSRYNEPSQAPIPQMLSNSQPSIPLIEDNQPTSPTSQKSLPYIQSSPLTPAPSSPIHALPPTNVPHSMPSNGAHTPSSTSRTHQTDLRLPTTPKVISPRYHLRKRPAPPLVAPKPSKRPKKHVSPENCSVPVSSKSMDSRNRPHEETGSPSSRTLRQRSTTSTRGKRKRA